MRSSSEHSASTTGDLQKLDKGSQFTRLKLSRRAQALEGGVGQVFLCFKVLCIGAIGTSGSCHAGDALLVEAFKGNLPGESLMSLPLSHFTTSTTNTAPLRPFGRRNSVGGGLGGGYARTDRIRACAG
jgi:hypothetical protein